MLDFEASGMRFIVYNFGQWVRVSCLPSNGLLIRGDEYCLRSMFWDWLSYQVLIDLRKPQFQGQESQQCADFESSSQTDADFRDTEWR